MVKWAPGCLEECSGTPPSFPEAKGRKESRLWSSGSLYGKVFAREVLIKMLPATSLSNTFRNHSNLTS